MLVAAPVAGAYEGRKVDLYGLDVVQCLIFRFRMEVEHGEL
jgi:hypothetical protein